MALSECMGLHSPNCLYMAVYNHVKELWRHLVREKGHAKNGTPYIKHVSCQGKSCYRYAVPSTIAIESVLCWIPIAIEEIRKQLAEKVLNDPNGLIACELKFWDQRRSDNVLDDANDEPHD